MPLPRAIILSEIMRGKSFELTKDIFTIGRTEDNDICIPDGTLSSKHAELRKDGDAYKVVDVGSTNGTRINGERIMESPLSSSDILQVGGIEILYDCEDTAHKQSNTTQTNINLDMDTNLGLKDMQNINPIKTGGGPAEGGTGGKKGFVAVIALLSIVVLVLLGMVAMKLMG
ncbi:MAG: FHA domain-containing protein [Lentisphaeraceae bacterium]|nr:FHA domain-containing protein [Lentisphaeraceae bacterium]